MWWNLGVLIFLASPISWCSDQCLSPAEKRTLFHISTHCSFPCFPSNFLDSLVRNKKIITNITRIFKNVSRKLPNFLIRTACGAHPLGIEGFAFLSAIRQALRPRTWYLRCVQSTWDFVNSSLVNSGTLCTAGGTKKWRVKLVGLSRMVR